MIVLKTIVSETYLLQLILKEGYFYIQGDFLGRTINTRPIIDKGYAEQYFLRHIEHYNEKGKAWKKLGSSN